MEPFSKLAAFTDYDDWYLLDSIYQAQHIVEPPNGGIIKGVRKFSMRGYEKGRCEWKLITAALNLRRMATL